MLFTFFGGVSADTIFHFTTERHGKEKSNKAIRINFAQFHGSKN